MVQWLRLHIPNAENPGLSPSWGSRSHMPQLKIPQAATKTQQSQINKDHPHKCGQASSNLLRAQKEQTGAGRGNSLFFFFLFVFCPGHQSSWFSSLQTLSLNTSSTPVLRPSALDWELYHHFPWFSGLWTHWMIPLLSRLPAYRLQTTVGLLGFHNHMSQFQ